MKALSQFYISQRKRLNSCSYALLFLRMYFLYTATIRLLEGKLLEQCRFSS